jgi:ubiquinone/menaquinone biosynthesis C-methylase UbiE
MGFADLIANNVLLRWLIGRSAANDLSVTMSGVRIGERVLQVGVGDGALLAALAAKVGMSGRACGIDEDAAAVARADRAAAKGGVLVELEHAAPGPFPYDPGAFDVVVFSGVGASGVTSPPACGEAARVLRPGGRCLVILKAGRASDEIVALLRQSGFRAARLLAEREGQAFVEGATDSGGSRG